MRKELREQLEAYRALQKKSAAAKADNAARNRAEKRAKAASAKAGDADADTTLDVATDADTTLDVATDAVDDDETAMDESVDMSASHAAASDDAAQASPAPPAPDAMELEGERHA
ncbi:hypothetical protein CBS9595_000138 [Malassezia furfur]|nr:hypothetical protein CBS9595_000138 [Malassezia furfur]